MSEFHINAIKGNYDSMLHMFQNQNKLSVHTFKLALADGKMRELDKLAHKMKEQTSVLL